MAIVCDAAEVMRKPKRVQVSEPSDRTTKRTKDRATERSRDGRDQAIEWATEGTNKPPSDTAINRERMSATQR